VGQLMTLDELIAVVSGSSVDDWLTLNIHTTHGWEHGSTNGQPYTRPSEHDRLSIYRQNVDVSIAFGATVSESFQESWVTKFPNDSASSQAVWLRYRGSVVNEWVGVSVDGGRYFLPMPEPSGDTYSVSRSQLPFASLMFSLYGGQGVHQTLEDALERAGITIAS
jgi:hypothetical protein